jgi:hypothetical protein
MHQTEKAHDAARLVVGVERDVQLDARLDHTRAQRAREV